MRFLSKISTVKMLYTSWSDSLYFIIYIPFFLILPRLRKLPLPARMVNHPRSELATYQRHCPTRLEVPSTIRDSVTGRGMQSPRCQWSSSTQPGKGRDTISINSHLRHETCACMSTVTYYFVGRRTTWKLLNLGEGKYLTQLYLLLISIIVTFYGRNSKKEDKIKREERRSSETLRKYLTRQFQRKNLAQIKFNWI